MKTSTIACQFVHTDPSGVASLVPAVHNGVTGAWKVQAPVGKMCLLVRNIDAQRRTYTLEIEMIEDKPDRIELAYDKPVAHEIAAESLPVFLGLQWTIGDDKARSTTIMWGD
jgi:hypothetical protein